MLFKLNKGKTNAPRLGVLHTSHGEVTTPCFMPVGSLGTVKAMAPWDLEEIGAEIILANTYHLILRPGVDVVEQAGGLHSFMGWNKPILTDSGGYQVVSLGENVKITEEAVEFRSHIDGSPITLTPEGAVEAQGKLGSDIAMVLDEPVALPAERVKTAEATARTIRWAKRCKQARDEKYPSMALFGIVQGGVDKDLRRESVQQTVQLDFDGYAIGGLSVGEGNEELHETAEYTAGLLPFDKPRYLMGVGKPSDIIRAIGYGVDMFDCVVPTRNARNGWIYTQKGALRVKHAKYKYDHNPPDTDCQCRTCRNFSMSYLRHLYLSGEILAGMLITRHNLYFYMELIREARKAIQRDEYESFAKAFLSAMSAENNENDREIV